MYEIPPQADLIGVKRGRVAFFRNLNLKKSPPNGHKTGRNWHYYLIPAKAVYVVFDKVNLGVGGWEISPPRFIKK